VIERVLLALGTMQDARGVMAAAREWITFLDSDLHVVHVVSPSAPVQGQDHESLVEDLERLARETRLPLRGRPVVLGPSPVCAAVLQAAESVAADAILVARVASPPCVSNLASDLRSRSAVAVYEIQARTTGDG
jgi:K+-sensing histidine kinase KdpD